MKNEHWENNELQFARLIHEVDTTQVIDWDDIGEQMGLFHNSKKLRKG